MRIVIVSSSFPQGSSEAFLIQELLEMRKQGNDILIVPMRPLGGLVHAEAGFLEACSAIRGLVDPGILAAAFLEFLHHPLHVTGLWLRLFRQGARASIVAKNLLVFPKGLWLARLTRGWGADHIHAYWLSASSTMAMIAAKTAGIPWSATGYRWDIAENNMISWKSRSAQFFRVADRSGAEELSSLTAADGCPVVTIHSGAVLPGVGLEEFQREARAIGFQEKGTPAGRKVILMPAMFVAKKGHAYLVEALALLRDEGLAFLCLLVGDGPLKASVQAKVAEYGMSDLVEFRGAISHSALLGLMSPPFCDLVVLPSIVSAEGEKEGIPMSLIEAMAEGVPVVATDNGGIPELLEPDCGIMVQQADPRALAAGIKRVLTDNALALALVAAGQKRVLEGYAAPAIAARLLEMFAEEPGSRSELEPRRASPGRT